MTNSTTPDSPQRCPTCGSSRRELRNTPTNAANPQYWKNTSDWEPSYYKCADPFHTSLPTRQQTRKTSESSSRMDVVADDSAEARKIPRLSDAGSNSDTSLPTAPTCYLCGKIKEHDNHVENFALPGKYHVYHRERREAAHPSETLAGEQEGSTALESWMTREAFEWMDAALGLDAELHPYLAELIPAKEDVSSLDRERWQKVVDVIYRSADHADAMPKVLQDRAPRKGPHSLRLRRTI